jgi:hypothetical protein
MFFAYGIVFLDMVGVTGFPVAPTKKINGLRQWTLDTKVHLASS